MRFSSIPRSLPRRASLSPALAAAVLLGPALCLAQSAMAPAPAPVPALAATPATATATPAMAGAGATPATRPATATAPAAPRASSGIYRSTDARGQVRYGTVETPGAMEVTRESIRSRAVTAPPLDTVTPEYRVEVADTCSLWRDRVSAWRNAREVFVREDDGRVRLLPDPERQQVVARFTRTSNYWCRAGAAEKIQREYALAEARRLAAAEKAALTGPKVIKVEQR